MTADPVVPQAPLVVTVEDVSRILVTGSGAMRQPPGEQALLSKPLIVYTDPSPRTPTTTDHAAPFDIVRRVTVLTDTAEELQGH